MKTVLFITWGCFGQQDMVQAFYKLGFKIATFPLKDRGYPKDKEKYSAELKKNIKESKADFVFSFKKKIVNIWLGFMTALIVIFYIQKCFMKPIMYLPLIPICAIC